MPEDAEQPTLLGAPRSLGFNGPSFRGAEADIAFCLCNAPIPPIIPPTNFFRIRAVDAIDQRILLLRRMAWELTGRSRITAAI